MSQHRLPRQARWVRADVCQHGSPDGRDGAINRLIEMADRISADEKPGDWVFKRGRADPTERLMRERLL